MQKITAREWCLSPVRLKSATVDPRAQRFPQFAQPRRYATIAPAVWPDDRVRVDDSFLFLKISVWVHVQIMPASLIDVNRFIHVSLSQLKDFTIVTITVLVIPSDSQVYTGNMRQHTAGTVTTEPGTAGCLYDLAGKLCGQPVRARGFCSKHYKVLNRRGAFKPAGSVTLQPTTTTEQIDRNLGHLERARIALDKHAEKLVEHLMTAAEVAARKGDASPAQWGLLHTRTIAPVITSTGTAGKGGADAAGIRVFIGVQLGQGSTANLPAVTPTSTPHTIAPAPPATVQNASDPDPAVHVVEATLVDA